MSRLPRRWYRWCWPQIAPTADLSERYVRFPSLHTHPAQVLQVIPGNPEVLQQYLGRYMPSPDLRYCPPFIGGVPVRQYLHRCWFGFQVLPVERVEEDSGSKLWFATGDKGVSA